MPRITFDKPKAISEIKQQYDMKKVSVLTTPNLFPLVKGIEFDGDFPRLLRKRAFPIKRKMDTAIELYQNVLLKEWEKAKKKLLALKNKVKDFKKMDYNNAQTIDRIAFIPFKYKKQFVEVANKYDLNLALLDKIVINSSLLVNARYDSRKNLLEFNPDYLEQHGMIRIGDSGELISETAKTFIHEFGHCIWYNSLTEEDRRYWQGLSRFLTREQLTGDMTQYVVGEKKRFDGSTMYSPYYTVRDDAFVSVYARFNVREDFAECYLYYKVSSKTLERIDNRKSLFLEDKIGNRMTKDLIKQDEEDLQNDIDSGYEPEIAEPNKVRDQIIMIFDDMKDGLSSKAKEHVTNAYNLGRQKGAYYAGLVFLDAMKQEDKARVAAILDRNDKFLDGFADDLVDDYDEVLFNMSSTGMVESEKSYEDINEFDNEFDGVMDNSKHRLGLYAINGLGLGLIAGMLAETEEEFAGGYWHTSEDDRVCDGCDKLDGMWMSYNEFETLFGNNECDGNCRCAELFEPALAPGDNSMKLTVHSTMTKEYDESKHSRDEKGRWSSESGQKESGYQVGDGGVADDTYLHRMDSGRDTGHFGTGVYFFSSKDKVDKYAEPEGRGFKIMNIETGEVKQTAADDRRPVTEIKLEGKNLFRPNSAEHGLNLHETLKEANELSWKKKVSDDAVSDLKMRLGWVNINIPTEKISEHLNTTRKDVDNYLKTYKKENKETLSTRLMREAGYDGIDVRHLPALDNSTYGSVLYANKKTEKMTKNGQNAYAETGTLGTTVSSTQLPGKNKTIAVDFHGTIMVNDKPNPPVVDKLREMQNAGYHIVVYTSGITESPGQLNGINNWLQTHKIPYDEVWQRQGKPDADVYIDDKSVNPNKENIKNLEV